MRSRPSDLKHTVALLHKVGAQAANRKMTKDDFHAVKLQRLARIAVCSHSPRRDAAVSRLESIPEEYILGV